MPKDTGDPDAGTTLPDFVTIAVEVAPDKMSALISLAPVPGAPCGKLTQQHLKAALEEAEVARGLEPASLRGLVDDYNASPRAINARQVASGRGPEPERIGALRIIVKHLKDGGDINSARASKYAWEIASFAGKFQRVDHGTVVARRKMGSPSLLGYDVFGGPIEPPPMSEEERSQDSIIVKNNLYIAGYTYASAVTGIAYADQRGLPGVIPLAFDGMAEVTIAPDKMSASVAVAPAGEGGAMPTEAELREMLRGKGVLYGVNDGAVANLMAMFARGLSGREEYTIAEGAPPVKGDDGRVDFTFNTDSSPTPIVADDGNADYKSISIVTSVGAGSVLARLIHPKKGTPGMNVIGRVLPALDGAPVRLPIGANTAASPDDPDTLVALADGIARFDGAAVNVSEGYSVPGDVDYSTGSINYEKSIVINGDIKSGFGVTCGGDLQVSGLIEYCMVAVEGNVLCRYGFVGNGKGVIEAKGDVNLNFMKNQTVIAGGNVNIAKEAINSSITAHKSIKVYGNSLSVAGGTLVANESIVLKTVGNISGVKTTLQIEHDPELVREASNATDAIAQLEDNIKRLNATISALPPTKRNDKEFMRKMKNAIIVIRQQIATLEDRVRVLNTAMNKFENRFVRIDRCAYPGTTIKFGTKNMALSDMLAGGKTIRVVDSEIRVL
ncbi:MAG: FapA family protein [Chitinispirillales bacterium]|jgi:uncharacterized protein (DUF342 family)|nr:FapA family protein [Chitinispirillales bacterium]